MKHFRQIAFALFMIICASGLTFFVSCKDKCGSTTCQNGGTCTDNVCVCPKGYSGSSCGSAWTDKYVGTYKCTSGVCTPASTGTTTWQSAITKDATNGGYSVDIASFAGANLTIVATVDTLGVLTIALPTGTYGISGHGTMVGSTITMDYTLSTASGAGGYSCNFTMVKE